MRIDHAPATSTSDRAGRAGVAGSAGDEASALRDLGTTIPRRDNEESFFESSPLGLYVRNLHEPEHEGSGDVDRQLRIWPGRRRSGMRVPSRRPVRRQPARESLNRVDQLRVGPTRKSPCGPVRTRHLRQEVGLALALFPFLMQDSRVRVVIGRRCSPI